MKTIRMEEMTWPDIKAAIESGFTTVVAGVGATEQHGPHLPAMTDARIGDEVAHRVARILGHALQARTINVGVSGHHLAFAGTLSVKPDTLRLVLRDYVDSLVRHGFRQVVLLPMHGGNFPTVAQAIDEARRAHPEIAITGYTDLMGVVGVLTAASAEFGVSADETGAHAGESETSIMLALERRLVATDRLAPGYVGPAGDAEMTIILEQGMPARSPTGVLGDPRTASAERGEVYLDRLAAFVAAKVAEQARQLPRVL